MSVSVKYNRGGGSIGDYSLTSPNNTIQVVDVENGHEIEVSQELINTINSKQDKMENGSIYVSGLQSQYFWVNYPRLSSRPTQNFKDFRADIIDGVSTPVKYIPIVDIHSINLGKAQLSFEVFSREDSFGYYAKYLFASRHNLGGNYALQCCCYVNNNRGYFTKDSIVVCPWNTGENAHYTIFKRVEDSNNDFFLVNVLTMDKENYSSQKWYYVSNQNINPTQELLTPRYNDENSVTRSYYTWNVGGDDLVIHDYAQPAVYADNL